MKLFRKMIGWLIGSHEPKQQDLVGRQAGQLPLDVPDRGQQLFAFRRGEETHTIMGLNRADAEARLEKSLKQDSKLFIRIPRARINAIAHSFQSTRPDKRA